MKIFYHYAKAMRLHEWVSRLQFSNSQYFTVKGKDFFAILFSCLKLKRKTNFQNC